MKTIKTTLLILSVIISCLSGQSQNWTPVNPAYHYTYSKGGQFSDLVAIQTDSVHNTGNTQTCYLNRIVQPWPAPYDSYTHINCPQFLKKSCLLNLPDSFCFIDPGIYIIKPFLPVDSPWVFDPVSGISATITDVYIDTLAGIADSVKCILLSSNDTILLSKEHGIILFQIPGDSLSCKLTGIKELNWGQQIPGFNEFVSFNVNDVFEYHYLLIGESYHSHSYHSKWYQDKILSKTTGPGFISYLVDHIESDTAWYYDSYGNHTDTTSNTQNNDTITYLESNTDFLNYYNNQLFTSSVFHYQVLDFSCDSTFNTNVKKFDSRTLESIYGDSARVTGNPHTLTMRYGESRGLIYSYEYEYVFGSLGYHTTTLQLQGCIIDSVTYGVLHPYGWIMNSPEIKTENHIRILPNPTTGIIRIEGCNAMKYTRTVIYNTRGELMKTEITKGESLQIDIQSLSPGIYIVRIETPEACVTKRIIKI
ncbi:MAG: T9SS type A sorting domain-containing protein [Bacteroidetes bacterium]|nr:T9SS type A sorting domain-containing protein [Bacteroidota bacterium]